LRSFGLSLQVYRNRFPFLLEIAFGFLRQVKRGCALVRRRVWTDTLRIFIRLRSFETPVSSKASLKTVSKAAVDGVINAAKTDSKNDKLSITAC
jgi:hypothetical protein